MRHLHKMFTAVFLLLNALACSSGGSFTGAGSSTAAACGDLARAQCQKRESCSLDSFSNDYTYGNEAQCEAQTAPTCVSALSAQGTGQSAANVENCVANYGNYSCTDYRDNDPSGACIPPAGTFSNGAACGANAQCSSSFCHIAQYQTCGDCAATPVVGAPCDYTGDCGRNMTCVIPSGAASGTCAAFVTTGGSCLTGSMPCQAGLACVGDNVTQGTTGTCQPQANTAGADCDRSRRTAPNCDFEYGLTCVPSAASSGVGTCQPMTLVAVGQTCGVFGTAPVTGEAVCNAGGLCAKANATDATGTCVAAALDGKACNSDATVGPPCLPPAKCVPSSAGVTSGTCVVPDATKCK